MHPPVHCTYWDSVIAKHDVEGSEATNIFVAVGFDMWQVWSSIVIERNYGGNNGSSNAYDGLSGNPDGLSFVESFTYADGKCSSA
jgi:hypothetical protein